jgi:acetyl esterase/lipase
VDGVAWREAKELGSAGPTTRVYRFDPSTGTVTFGDGTHGAAPPSGAIITASYASGPHEGFVDFYRAMKRVNPEIRVCAAMTKLEGLGTFARTMGSEHPYDCVSQHPYVVPADLSDSLDLDQYRNRLFREAERKEEQIRTAGDSVRHYGGSPGAGAGPAEIVVTEYGHLGNQQPRGVEHYHRSMDEGLLLADNLISWMRLGVPLADRANLTDFTFTPPPGGSTIVGAPDNAILSGPAPHLVPQPTARVLSLFARLRGGSLRSAKVVDGPALNSVAATDSAGRLHLLVVNHHATDAIAATVAIDGFQRATTARARTVAGSGPLAFNTPADPDAVSVEERDVQVGSGAFDYTFPAHSVTDLELAPDPTPLTVALWPTTPPGTPSARAGERSIARPPDPVRGAITRVTDITQPTLTLYRPARATGPTPAVIVFPGGGYQLLAVDIEGTEICDRFTRAGVACALVKYRVPQPSGPDQYLHPLQDAQRAIGLVRTRAREWGIDPARVGVLGFSAGGHVAAVLSNHFADLAYPAVDAADSTSRRPDFAILIYPAYLVVSKEDARLSPLVQPTADTPPTFLVQTMDDPIGPENAASYAMALDKAGVPAELHLYPTGGHGYGLRPASGEVAVAWPGLAMRWLAGLGILESTVKPASTFANPLDLDYRFMPDDSGWRTAADPVITRYRDEYYLFATASGGYWHSPDLRDWTLVVPRGLPMDAPAPAILIDGDRMYYTAHKLGAVYTTDDPARGEWREVAKIPAFADPMLFRDDDGRIFLYHGSELNGSIHVVQLDPARGFAPVGPSTTLLTASYRDHGWERSGPDNLGAAGMREGFRIGPYVEGPWMTKHDGTYYLQYAAPGTIWKTYADGVYTSSSPTGPFVYAPYSPFSYKPGGFIGGAGHSSTFQDRAGNYWRVSTMIISVAHKFERRLGIFPAGFDGDGVLRADTYLGDFPRRLPDTTDRPLQDDLVGWMLLSGGKTITASSTLEGHGATLAVDEDIRTWWSARTGRPGEWLQVDLGNLSTVRAIQVNFGEQGATAAGRDSSVYQQYRVESSEDGRSWQLLIDRSQDRRDTPHAYVQLDSARAARYLRITNLHTAGGGNFAIRGLRVFGLGAAEPPSAVSSLMVERDATDGRNATISWEPARGARSYVVRFGIRPDHLYASYEVGDATRLEIHSLNVGVPYFFAVDALNENGIARGETHIQ